MDQRVDRPGVPQPEVERDIGVARGQGGIVVLGLALVAPAAIGLQGEGEAAELQGAEVEGVVGDGGVVGGLAPAGGDGSRRRDAGRAARSLR